MKKILVVLLVLAAATGVFAQEGEWSLGGNVEIGALVDFTGDDIFVYGQTYNIPYNGWGPIHGFLGVGYTRDALSLGLDFHSSQDDFLRGNVKYDAGNYALQWQSNLLTFFEGDTNNHQRLWGYYKLLNEMVKLEVAVTSPDQEYWVSDKTAAFVRHLLTIPNNGGPIPSKWWAGQALNDQPWATTKSFAWVDRGNYLLADVTLSSLEFGVMLPNVFGTGGGTQLGIDNDNKQGIAVNLLEGVMKNALIGFKFTMQPIEVAAQFQFGSYGVYFGGKWFIGPVTAGLSFSGILNPDDPDKKMRFGGGIEYNPGVFGAWVTGFYALDGSTTSRNTQIGIEPGFFYNVIPSHLQFRTNVGFYFSGGKAGGDKKDLEVGWGVQPELFWNFLGTGAGSYWAYGTGMIVRYRLLADGSAWGGGRMGKTNALDVNFKFSY
jgi:hypothetical protein